MTISQAARKSGLSSQWIRNAIWVGKLTAVKDESGVWQIAPEDFQQWREQITPTLEKTR